MFYKLSRYALYASLIAPLVLVRQSFFPFISYKALYFRFTIELALFFFIVHILLHLHDKKFLQQLKAKLSHPIIICLALLGLTFTLAALIGVNPTQSFWSNFERGDGALQVLHYIAFAILAVSLFSDKKSYERILVANIIISVPLCIYALLQLLAPVNTTNWFIVAPGDRVSGTLGNPSYLAAYLIFNLVFIIYFLLKKNSGWRIPLCILFLFEFFILLKTGTRGAFLAVIAGFLLIAIINFFITHSKKIRVWLGVAIAGVIILTGVFFTTSQATIWNHVPVLNRLVNLNSALNDIKPRIWTWSSGLSGFLERPVTGWGAENFPVPFDKYYSPNHYGIESFFDRTHNIFLEYAISGGLLVLLPWLAVFWFYYRRLQKRPKDFWYSVLFATPIMYLIQGFFLFDTLPIYLTWFLFLMLFINTESPETKLVPSSKPLLQGTAAVTAPLFGLGLVFLIYYTIALPVTKNVILVSALKMQNDFTSAINVGQPPKTSPASIINEFKRAIEFNSPIGQEEAVGMYQKYVLSLIEIISQNETVRNDPQSSADVKLIVDDVNKVHDKYLNIYPGLKQQYINGGINLRAGIAFNYPEYLNRGKKMFNEALKIAPTRLEFMRILIELARIENDQEALNLWGRRANLYRPDLFKLDEVKTSS